MSDLRESGAREIEPTSNKSKAIAAFIVAIGVGAAGAYVYTSNGGLPQKTQQQHLAMNEPAPLTPPPPAQTAVPTTPQVEKTAVPDVTPPVQTAAPSTTPPSTARPARVARIKSRAEQLAQPALTSPEATSVPDIPAQSATQPAPAQTTPPPMTPQATPDASQQPQPDEGQGTPQ